ncbi:hypothetical protein ACVMAJ_005549 [Bradyrhizobium sp. USDA 4448]
MLSAGQSATAVGLEEAIWLSARLGELPLVALAGSNLDADWVYVPFRGFRLTYSSLKTKLAPRLVTQHHN